MKRLLAKAILTAATGMAATAIGATVRGPYAEGLHKDFAVGAGILAAMAALKWAASELGVSDDAGDA